MMWADNNILCFRHGFNFSAVIYTISIACERMFIW